MHMEEEGWKGIEALLGEWYIKGGFSGRKGWDQNMAERRNDLFVQRRGNKERAVLWIVLVGGTLLLSLSGCSGSGTVPDFSLSRSIPHVGSRTRRRQLTHRIVAGEAAEREMGAWCGRAPNHAPAGLQEDGRHDSCSLLTNSHRTSRPQRPPRNPTHNQGTLPARSSVRVRARLVSLRLRGGEEESEVEGTYASSSSDSSASSSFGMSRPGDGDGIVPGLRGLDPADLKKDESSVDERVEQGEGKGAKRSLKELQNTLEGRDDKTFMISAPVERDPGVEQGSFTGRNPKKLKHRRLDAVEVAMRELKERGMMDRGEFDEKGLEKLLDAQEEREQAQALGYTEGTPNRQWTMEDLDKEFPTEEGNRRLGIAPEQPETIEVDGRKRWEPTGHLVQMRRSGHVPDVIPQATLNYTPRNVTMTLFVAGSTEERYALEAHEDDTIAEFKEQVWAYEREFRYPDGKEGEKQKARDEASGFKIEKQDLWHNGSLCSPDSVTLKFLNISDYDLLRLCPKPPHKTQEELAMVAKYYIDILWWHERQKVWELESDSDEERDEGYKQVKQAYLQASDEQYRDQCEMLVGFKEFTKIALKEFPNLGMMPHPDMSEEDIARLNRELDTFITPEHQAKLEKEAKEYTEKLFRPPGREGNFGAASTDEPFGDLPIFVHPEFIEAQVDRSLETGLPYVFVEGENGREATLKELGCTDEEAEEEERNQEHDGANALGGRRAGWGEDKEHFTFDLPKELEQEVREVWAKLHRRRDEKRENAEMSAVSRGTKKEKKHPTDTSSESEQFRDHPVQFEDGFD